MKKLYIFFILILNLTYLYSMNDSINTNEIVKMEISNKPMCLVLEQQYFFEVTNKETIRNIYKDITENIRPIKEFDWKTSIIWKISFFSDNRELLYYYIWAYPPNPKKLYISTENKYFIMDKGAELLINEIKKQVPIKDKEKSNQWINKRLFSPKRDNILQRLKKWIFN